MLLTSVAPVALSNSSSLNASQPLAPEIAFAPEILEVQPGAISISYHIEDGYYLYRDKLEFSINREAELQPDNTSGLKLNAPLFQEATVINDEFFGEQAIFRNSTQILLPYASDNSTERFTLDIKYQGCADMGLCYPPNTISLDVSLPATDSLASIGSFFTQDNKAGLTSSASPSNPQETLTESFFANGDMDEILPPEMAYLPQIVAAHRDAIDVRWFIEDGYYLYRDKISFSLETPDGLRIGNERISEGTEQFDEFFGNVHVLRHSAEARMSLQTTDSSLPVSGKPANAQLLIHYQGCADIGICFPPTTASLPVSFNVGEAETASSGLIAMVNSKNSSAGGGSGESSRVANTIAVGAPPATVVRTSNSSGLPAQSEQDRLTSLLGSASIWLTIATFFGLGLLLAFTPCVLPMVPILSSLIVGQKQTVSTARAFQLSLVYVLVMASTYALVGIAVGLSGYNIQAFLQNPVVLSGIALLFVVLSLSMFGFYEMQMPTGLQNRLTKWSNDQGGGQFGGVAAMGFISTLIVGPCVTAPLAGALLYIAKTGDAMIGGTALFALGLGMGAPLLLIGTSAGKFVPSAGEWMNKTKNIFGILMLAMAIYMVSRFLPSSATMALYAILAIMSGIYLGAYNRLSKADADGAPKGSHPKDSHQWQMIGKTAGIALGLYGVALLVGAMGGGSNYLRPLGAFTASGNGNGGSVEHRETEHALPFQLVKSVAELEQIVSNASATNTPVMLDFYADWCISCKEMEARTFTDERVQQLLSNAVVLQADVTRNDKLDQELLKHFDLFGPPGIIFYDARGVELKPARVVGFMNADSFTTHIEGSIGRPVTRTLSKAQI